MLPVCRECLCTHNFNGGSWMIKRRFLKVTASLILTVLFICLLNFLFVPPMNDHWANRDRKISENEIDTVFIGDSLGMYSVQPSVYDKEFNSFSYNACTACQDFSDSYFLLLDYINSFPRLKEVFLMLDYYNFSLDLNYGVSSRLVQFNRIRSPYLKAKYLYETCPINDWYNIVIKKALYKTDPNDVIKNINVKMSREYRNYNKLTNEDVFYCDKGYVCTYMTNHNESDQSYDVSKMNTDSLRYFNKIIELCNKKNIRLSVIHSPMTLNRMKSLKNYNELYLTVKSACESFNINYYDYNYPSKIIDLDYTSDFKDNTHLNYYGSCKFMKHLCRVLSGDKEALEQFNQQ